MSDQYERHGKLEPSQVVTRPEPSISTDEKEAEDMAEQMNQSEENAGGGSPSQLEVAGEIVLVDLNLIRLSPDNPNYHSPDQVELLARNIKNCGLRNPIELKKVVIGGQELYEILTGEGRFRAYCHLRDSDASDEWMRIPAIIRDEDTNAADTSGIRLSENALRWFNWAAECVEAASIKANGATLQHLMETFGYGKTIASGVAATGQCLSMIGLSNEQMFRLTGILSREDFFKYVVPLRIRQRGVQSERGQQGFQPADPTAYDYTEVRDCIDGLLSNKLKKEDLAAYLETHRTSVKKTGTTRATTDDERITKQTQNGNSAQSNQAAPPAKPASQQRKEGSKVPGAVGSSEKPLATSNPPALPPVYQGGAANSNDKKPPESAPGSSYTCHIAPTVQIIVDKPLQPHENDTPQDDTDSNPADWITAAISDLDLSAFRWLLLGRGNPPEQINEGEHFIVYLNKAEHQMATRQTPERAQTPSEETVNSDQNPADAHTRKGCFSTHPEYCNSCVDEHVTTEDCKACGNESECIDATCGISSTKTSEQAKVHDTDQKECFGRHPDGIEPDCMLCPAEGACCEAVSQFPVPSFGSNPEYSDRGIPTAYDCRECPHLTECVMETIAVIDDGKINFSHAYGDLKGSECWSELFYVLSGSDTQVLATSKFAGKKMRLTSRKWARAIKPFVTDDRVKEVFQRDHLGNMITRTTKNPTKTIWYVSTKKKGTTV